MLGTVIYRKYIPELDSQCQQLFGDDFVGFFNSAPTEECGNNSEITENVIARDTSPDQFIRDQGWYVLSGRQLNNWIMPADDATRIAFSSCWAAFKVRVRDSFSAFVQPPAGRVFPSPWYTFVASDDRLRDRFVIFFDEAGLPIKYHSRAEYVRLLNQPMHVQRAYYFAHRVGFSSVLRERFSVYKVTQATEESFEKYVEGIYPGFKKRRTSKAVIVRPIANDISGFSAYILSLHAALMRISGLKEHCSWSRQAWYCDVVRSTVDKFKHLMDFVRWAVSKRLVTRTQLLEALKDLPEKAQADMFASRLANERRLQALMNSAELDQFIENAKFMRLKLKQKTNKRS